MTLLGRQLRQRCAILLQDRLLRGMPSFGDDPAPTDHHVTNRVAIAGKDDGVEQHVAGLADQVGLIPVDDDQVGTATGLQPTYGPAKGLTAAGQCLPEERCTDGRRLIAAAGQNVAAPT